MSTRFSPSRRFFAWCVHGYTALGLARRSGIAELIVEGTEGAFCWAFVVMLAATLIDATDGLLARAVRVKEVLPASNGRRLDDIIDFLTYAALPLLLVWRAGILPARGVASGAAGGERVRVLPGPARRPRTATSSGFPRTGISWRFISMPWIGTSCGCPGGFRSG